MTCAAERWPTSTPPWPFPSISPSPVLFLSCLLTASRRGRVVEYDDGSGDPETAAQGRLVCSSPKRRHRQLQHPTKPGTVTVSGHPSQDIHPKTLNSILRQAGLRKK